MSSAFLHLMEEPEQATQKGHKDQKQDHQRMGSDDPFDYRVCHQRARQNPCQERWQRGSSLPPSVFVLPAGDSQGSIRPGSTRRFEFQTHGRKP